MGCAEWKKGAHSSGEMKSIDELFGDEVMGYSAKEPQQGGFSGSIGGEGKRVTDPLVPGGGVLPMGQKEEMLRLMSGGARKSRKTRRGGRKMRKSRKSQRGGRRTTTKQGRKPFLNLRISGRIRMKQRHRQ